jgi:phosphate transport system substrate-binding protein
MDRRILAFALLGLMLRFGLPSAAGQEQPDEKPDEKPDVRISASISTMPLLTAAARMLKEQKGLRVAIATHLTSLDDLDDLSQGTADIAFITKPLTGTDRARYPEMELVEVPVGMQVVALGVSNDLWDAGIHTIKPQTMRDIYEQKVKNWKELGGPDEKITLFSFEEGTGVWEIFAAWLYGDARKAPVPKVDNVANSQDARDALEFTPGAIAPIGAALVDNDRCHALGLDISGTVATPVPAAVASGAYPLVRPLVAVCNGRPTLEIRVVTEFLASDAGQALIKGSGAMGLEAVPKPAPTPESTGY